MDGAAWLSADFGEDIGRSFNGFLLDYLERYPGWQFAVSPEQVELAEGESADVDINVLSARGGESR
jgi:hypothetical protein